jgi:serine phosphatase RsbU (regulator of sigma subunit)
LCVFNKKTKVLNWAGANNPLWIVRDVRRETQDARTESRIEEIKADKQAIGYIEKPKPFTTHEIKLNEGDLIYLFSDGFPDQFGGPDGKKFMYRSFQRKIEGLSSKNLTEQYAELKTLFSDWVNRKGGINVKPMEQTDDVCVIGIRI